MSKTNRNYIPELQTSRKHYSGNGIKSIWVLGGGEPGLYGHSNHRYLKQKASRKLRAVLKEDLYRETQGI